MSQPSILTKDFWATQEDRLLELFALALAILEQKNLSDVVEEDAISRELYFCLREAMGVREVKAAVAKTETALPAAAKDALKDAVAKADPKKSPLSTAWKVVREVFRGL